MIRGVWSRDTIAWVIAASLLPTVAALLLPQGPPAAARIAIGIAVILGWQLVFRIASGVPMSPTAVLGAVAVAVLAPGDLAVWQLILALTFGTVIGELIFGGWGRNFLNGAVVTLAFLFVSFPQVAQSPAGSWIALASLPAAAMLLATGILSWRVLGSSVAALAVTIIVLGAETPSMATMGGVAFGFVYLVGDPVSSPSTQAGRVLYGALCGALTALLGQGYGAIGAPQAVVFATLLASIFAPLIDHGVIAFRTALKRRRHG